MLLLLLPSAAWAQVQLVLPPGELIGEWEEAFALAGLSLAPRGTVVELVQAGDGWVLRVHADDGDREARVAIATSSAEREVVAILAMSLLFPNPAEPPPAEVVPPEPAPAPADPPPRAREPSPVKPGLPPAEPVEPGVVEADPETERAEARARIEERERLVDAAREGDRDARAADREARDIEPTSNPDPAVDEAARARADAERATARAAEEERQRRAREEEREAARRAARDYDEARARERAEARRAAPPAAPGAAFVEGDVLVHRDSRPGFSFAVGGAARVTRQVRLGGTFGASLPVRLTVFADDGAVRRAAALGARFVVHWVPRSVVSPVIGGGVGFDVLRFTQDGAAIAHLIAPVVEVHGGIAFDPLTLLAVEPIVRLRVTLREIPMDVGGGQNTTLLPVAFLGGVRVLVGPGASRR